MQNAKTRFLEGPHAKRFLEISRDPATIAAFDAAMLYLCETQPVHDGQSAANSGLQIKGAIRFRDILHDIAIKNEKPKPKPDALNE